MALQSQLFRGDAKLEAAALSDHAHITQGAKGPHVGKIQSALNQLDGVAIAQDSAFGPATAAAVSAFKKKRQILNLQGRIDDIVGRKTVAALDREMLVRQPGPNSSDDRNKMTVAFRESRQTMRQPALALHRLAFQIDLQRPTRRSRPAILVSQYNFGSHPASQLFVSVYNGSPVMAKDVLETEHHSPREYEPEVNQLETQSLPRWREVQEAGVNPKYAPTVFVDPESVVPAADPDPRKPRKFLLKPVFPSAPYKVHVFQRGLKFVPTRIAAVVPGGLTEFNRALIFFHPLPTKRVGYDDGEYYGQTGGWHNIYRYCDQQGHQLAASKRKFVLFIPIFNLASTETCGRFPDEWKSLIEDLMVRVRNVNAPGLANQPRPALTDVVTASYSAGVKYMHTFLKRAATDLEPHLREVYDYDGRFSTHKGFSERLVGIHPKAKVVTYDQQPVKAREVEKEVKAGKGIHLPESRWRDLPGGLTSFLNVAPDPNVQPIAGSLLVHGAMARYMMFHSLSKSTFGH